MKKPEQHATTENDDDLIVIKNPFLVAKLEKAARDMGYPLDKVIVFFLCMGFDKPSRSHTQRMETAQRESKKIV